MTSALSGWANRRFTKLTTYMYAQYGTAVLRIGYGTAYLVFLLHEYPRHDSLWGPDSAFTPAMNRQFAADPGLDWFQLDRWWYSFLSHGGRTWFEFWYHAAILVCLLFLLGWRTRATSVGFALTIMACTGRNVFLTDGGDNIMGLMALYLAFTRCGLHWSLDARRARRRAERGIGGGSGDGGDGGSGGIDGIGGLTWPDTPFGRVLAELGRTRREFVTFLHNTAVLVIMFQICVVYAAAGLYKSQGSYWRNGTALYYALHLNWFRPWPAVSNFMASQTTMIAIVAYLTVFVQLAFPLAVWSKWLKYPSLVLLLGMHLSIALVMGLPLFSAAMMIGDAVFLPDALYLWVAAFVVRKVRAYWGRRRAPGGPTPLPALPQHLPERLPESRGDLSGGPHDAGADLPGVERGEGDDADAGLQAEDVADRSGEAMRPGL